MKSVMSHKFSEVPRAEIQRSSFNRSHGHKTTFDAGGLYPIFVDEALPGDTFNLNMTAFARLATPLKPIMDNMFMETFFFAVPIRLLWDNWQKFNGEQVNPDDSTDYIIPQQLSDLTNGFVANSVQDYFGLPVGVPNLSISDLWTRAYTLIWNEWFRDQNLQDSLPFDTGDGPTAPTVGNTIQKRGKRHDYFTSCLPWPQKGEAVTIPIGGNAPVAINIDSAPTFTGNVNGVPMGTLFQSTLGNTEFSSGATSTDEAATWLNPGLSGTADLSLATATTINALRESFQIQKLYERDARGGTRYTEIIKSHFGVTSPDSRLQRPEYLGGGSSPVNISPVQQTTQSFEAAEQQTPLGNLAAVGTVSASNHGFTKSFTEHCILIGLVCVRADLTYQQGINRMFSRNTRWDFFWPALAHIGEQEVLNKEIFADGTVADDTVFGYQERFAEYRYKPSQITGLFRSSHPQSLDVWHLSQDFASVPVLNDEFIAEDPPLDRIIATPDEPHFLFDSYFSLKCARPMPVYSVPGLIDHF